MTTAIMWFRRDLRVSDNHALLAALKSADEVVPVFCFDDTLRGTAAPGRLAFMYGCLEALDERLGGNLVLRTGAPAEIIPKLAKEVGANTVFASGESEPYGRDRDEQVAKALSNVGASLEHVGSPYAVDPGFIHKDDGTPYKVYTPFFNAWSKLDKGKAQNAPRNPNFKKVKSEKIPAPPKVDAELPPPGELAAQKRMKKFAADLVKDYDENRNLPGVAGTSKMSPYLKFGCIHPRQILDALGTGKGAFAYKREIAFRDFYADTLFHNPDSLEVTMQPNMRKLKQDTGKKADEKFELWKQGKTGFPIVDAGMRQLLDQAWMHNRVRMLVASFLIKDLHVDWQRGAEWFMANLVDGDPASNSQGWQWVAGTGRDPSPYFRIFNTVDQGKKFDKSGAYIRKFVPELRDVPDKFIHEPWLNPDGLPKDYPEPMVDHKIERQESLDRYAKTKS